MIDPGTVILDESNPLPCDALVYGRGGLQACRESATIAIPNRDFPTRRPTRLCEVHARQRRTV